MNEQNSKNDLIKRVKDILLVSVILVPLYAIAGHFGMSCPIKFITGISCAGCGMTRAWKSVMHGNLADAMYFHPLFWMTPIGFLWFILKDIINRRLYNIVMWIMIAAFLVVYIYRMIIPGDIVVCKPTDGLVLKILNLLLTEKGGNDVLYEMW